MSATTTTTAGLPDQIRALLAQAGPETVPSAACSPGGATPSFRAGDGNAPALTQAAVGGHLPAARERGARRRGGQAARAGAGRHARHPPGRAAADRDRELPRRRAAARGRALGPQRGGQRRAPALAAGAPGRAPSRCGASSRRAASCTSSGDCRHPVYRGRDVTFVLDAAFLLTNPGRAVAGPPRARPRRRARAGGRGRVRRPVPGPLRRGQRRGRRARPLRRRGAHRALRGRDLRPAGGARARRDLAAEAPAHGGQPSASGRAWVFRAPGRTEILNPVIVVEGFPGGHPCDYMYELLNQAGTVEALHADGYDLVIVGLDNGMIRRSRPTPGARAMHPRGTPAHAAAAGRRRREHGRDHQPLRARPDGEAPASRTARPRTSASMPRTAGPTRASGCSGSSMRCGPMARLARRLRGAARLAVQPAADDRVAGRHARSWRARCATALMAGPRGRRRLPRQPRKLAVSCGSGTGAGGAAAGRADAELDAAAVPVGGAQHAARRRRRGRRRGIVVPGRSAARAAALQGRSRVGDGARQPEHLQRPGGRGGGGVRMRPRRRGAPDDLLRADRQRARPRPGRLRPDRRAGPGPFDASTCSPANVAHLEITDEVSKWIVDGAGRRADARGAGPVVEPGRLRPARPGLPGRPLSDLRRSSASTTPCSSSRSIRASGSSASPTARRSCPGTAPSRSSRRRGRRRLRPPRRRAPWPCWAPSPWASSWRTCPTTPCCAARSTGRSAEQMERAPAIAAQRAAATLDAVRSSGHMELVADFAVPGAGQRALRHPRDPGHAGRARRAAAMGEPDGPLARRHAAAAGPLRRRVGADGAAGLHGGSRARVQRQRRQARA